MECLTCREEGEEDEGVEGGEEGGEERGKERKRRRGGRRLNKMISEANFLSKERVLHGRSFQHTYIPSTRDVSSESSVAFLRPGGSESPIVSSLCLRTWPPFLDLALYR